MPISTTRNIETYQEFLKNPDRKSISKQNPDEINTNKRKPRYKIYDHTNPRYQVSEMLKLNPKKSKLLTGNKDFQNSRSVLGASATFVAQEINMMRDPAARDKVDVNHGNGKAFKTFLL